jgi:imidazoleglycerol-phosphate dehydratase
MGDAKQETRVRSAALSRDTNETKIQLAINLDGGAFPANTDKRLLSGNDGHASQSSSSQTIAINSGIGFLDHMLHALAKHAGWSLALNCQGDLHSTLLCTSYWDRWEDGEVHGADEGQLTTITPRKMSALRSAARSKTH